MHSVSTPQGLVRQDHRHPHGAESRVPSHRHLSVEVASSSGSCLVAGHHRQQRCSRTRLQAVEGETPTPPAPETATRRMELPIFPLSMVAFPTTSVPLRIFEARYRVLFSTLLQGAQGIEEGLIQEDSPFAGTRRFGICWLNERRQLTAVGTVLEIRRHIRRPDGALDVECIGRERYQIVRVVKEKPVLICEVQVLEEEDDTAFEAKVCAEKVKALFSDLLQLSAQQPGADKLDETQATLGTLGPRELSYWMGPFFATNLRQQQMMLQETSLVERLRQQEQMLQNTVGYVRARTALEKVFSSAPAAEASPSSEPEKEPAAPLGDQTPLGDERPQAADQAPATEGESSKEADKPLGESPG